MELSAAMYITLNRQYNQEAHNSRLYTALANRFETLFLTGFAAHMDSQAAGEAEHAQKVRQYIIDRNLEPRLDALPGVSDLGANALDLCAAAVMLEQNTSAQWSEIYMQALEESDGGTVDLALWFLKEQIEEERTAQEWLGRVQFASGNSAALLVLDERAKA